MLKSLQRPSPNGLRERDAIVDDVALYDTLKVASDSDRGVFDRVFLQDEIETDLLNGRIDLVTFTSSSTVTNFVEMFPRHTPEALLTDVQVAVIGPETQKTAMEYGVQVDIVAKEASVESLAEAIVEAYQWT